MTKKARKLSLAGWQLDDSDRLKEIYRRKRGALKLTQEKISVVLGEGVNQGTVSLFMNRRMALNLEAAVVFARMLEVPVSEFSPTLAGQLITTRSSLTPFQNWGSAKEPVASICGPKVPFPGGDEFGYTGNDKDTFAQQNAATPGDRHVNSRVKMKNTLSFTKVRLNIEGRSQENPKLVLAGDNSMWPTISERDVLLVDESQIEPADDQIYVIASANKRMIAKRLFNAPTGGWIMRSDHEDKAGYPDQELSSSEASEHRIVGRVVWRGGDL